jgi:tetratricopeptide (TPR) repeat protein
VSAEDREQTGSPHATRLQPPDVEVRAQTRRAPALVWLAAALLSALAASVVFLLPALVAEPDEPSEVPSSIDSAEPAVIRSAGNPDGSRHDAEVELQRYLKLRARLELDGADRWGEPEWSESNGLVGHGDGLFGRSDYDAARQAYGNATELLTRLELSRENRLTDALQAGDSALEDDRSADAQAAYTMALAIDPENEAAIRGLARASVRDAVLGHLAAALKAERRGQMAEARTQYAAALTLDREHTVAADGRARVSAVIDKQAFEAAMTAALDALDDGRIADARDALDAAADVRPDAPAIADGQRRLAQKVLERDVAACRSRAARYEREEKWGAAIEQYEKMLTLVATSGFAIEGLQRTRARKKLNEQVGFYLEEPERLYSPERLAHATSLVTDASPLDASEPVLASAVKRLAVLIAEASRPLDLTIRSDGLTRVAIHHIGRLGQFEEQRVELLPGRYTVVGEREGYRDVRHVIELRPGDDTVNLEVRCEEPI